MAWLASAVWVSTRTPVRSTGCEDPLGGTQALVGEGRWHPDVDDGDVRRVGADGRPQRLGVGHGGDDLETRPPRGRGSGRSRNSPPSSAMTIRTAAPRRWSSRLPAGLVIRSEPPRAATRSSSPRKPCPRSMSAPPAPSSTTSRRRLVVGLPGMDGRVLRRRVFRGVRQGLGDDEIGGRLDGRRQSPVELGRRRRQPRSSARPATRARDRDRPRPGSPGGVPAPVRAARRSRPVLQSLAASSSARVAGSASVPSRRRSNSQRDPERHETLLRPIVEVPLDPPPFRVLRLGQPGPGCADRLELGADLGLEPLVLDRQADRRDGRRHEPGVVAQDRVVGDGEHRHGRRSRWSGRHASGRRSAAPPSWPGRVDEVTARRDPSERRSSDGSPNASRRESWRTADRRQALEPDRRDRRSGRAQRRRAGSRPAAPTAIEHPEDGQDQDTQLAGRRPGIGRDDRLEEEAAGEAEDEDDARQDDRRLAPSRGPGCPLPAGRDRDRGRRCSTPSGPPSRAARACRAPAGRRCRNRPCRCRSGNPTRRSAGGA